MKGYILPLLFLVLFGCGNNKLLYGPDVIHPRGWVSYCLREGENDPCCADYRLIRKVNYEVNNSITYTPDESLGIGDQWKPGVTAGDCDDFAITKRQKLLDLGWNTNRLHMTQCKTGDGRNHVVLICDVCTKQWVLDNRWPEPAHPHEFDYTWEATQDGQVWKALTQ